jgi:hypothetical protein
MCEELVLIIVGHAASTVLRDALLSAAAAPDKGLS